VVLFLLVDDWALDATQSVLVSGGWQSFLLCRMFRLLASTWRRTDTTCIHTSLDPLASERQLIGVSWLLVYLLGLESFAFVFDTTHVNVMIKFIGESHRGSRGNNAGIKLEFG
jgi:hypothetical protein